MCTEHLNARGAVLLPVEFFAKLGPDPVPRAARVVVTLLAITVTSTKTLTGLAATADSDGSTRRSFWRRRESPSTPSAMACQGLSSVIPARR